MSKTCTRWLRLSVGLAATTGFGWLLLHGLDRDALSLAFANLSLSSVLLALFFTAAAHAVRIVRWWWMLRGLEPDLPFGACVRPFLASLAINNVMPLRAGDAVRILGFRRQLRSSGMRILGTLVIERALDVVFLSGIFFLGVAGLPDGALPNGFVSAAAWLGGGGVAAMLVATILLPLRERLPGLRFFAKRPWAEAISGHSDNLVAALSLARSAPSMLMLAGFSAVVWLLEGAAFVSVAAVLHPGLSPLSPWLSLAAGTLATAIPSSPGYVGTFDYFVALGITSYGAPPEVAAAFALTVHAMWIPLTAAGLLCYWLPTTGHPRRVNGNGNAPNT